MTKSFYLLPCALSGLLLSAGCRLSSPMDFKLALSEVLYVHPDQKKEAALLFAELGGEEGVLQTCHYLYRWYLDENDFKRRERAQALQGQLWVRRIQTVTDEKDHSRFMELVFPALGVAVTLKKTDYRIDELKLDVKSQGYRVARISREDRSASEAKDYVRLEFAPAAFYERLFNERLRTEFPSGELIARLRERVAKEIADLPVSEAAKRGKTVYFAPVHKVANESWGYWEEGKILFRFTSDVDLTNPDIWAHDTLDVSIYDTASQTVVSHEEKPGDDSFITRDQVGRALYNCMVLGKKSVFPAPAPSAEQPAP